MALNNTAAAEFMPPAQRTDGTSTASGAIPEGAHLRIKPNVNLADIPMTPMVRMLAQAAQTYGIVIRDKTYGADVFYTQQPTAGQANPVTPLLKGQSLGTALKAFPWNDLEVLDAPVCNNNGSMCV
jgi:hypothetical protein